MTAAISTALRETADRAEADLCAKRTLSTVAEGEMHARALRSVQEADAAERELARANPFQADEEAWTNERALQEAQTEKEAHNA